MPVPAYTDPSRAEAIRAAAMGLTIAGAVGTALLGGEVLVNGAASSGVWAIALLLAGIAGLLWSRARLRALWAANRPCLLSEAGATVLAERRAYAGRALWLGRALLALFLVAGVAFFFLFSAISCGDSVRGYCGQVGTPPEPLVVVFQLIAVAIGCAWAATAYWRRRHADETERIDAVVAEGQRRRRNDGPLAGTDRTSWE